MAAIGARITIAMVPIMPRPLLLSRLPPKNMPNCASIEIAPAIVAVIVMVSVSWFLMCASSCAMTPATSSRLSELEQAGRHRDGGVLRVAPGREGVGLRVVHHEDARHRQAGALRQLVHHAHQIGRGALVDLLGAVHRQHHLVGVPVGEEVHAGRDQQRDDGAAAAADQVADTHEQGRQPCEQDGGTKVVHFPLPGRSGAQRASLQRSGKMSGAPGRFARCRPMLRGPKLA